MNIDSHTSDQAVLTELGARIARHRLERNRTQAELAEEAGISRPTVARLEGGASTQLSSLIRVLRVLGLASNLDALVPPPVPSPIDALRRQGRRRQRARSGAAEPPAAAPWTWDDEPGEP